MNAVPSYEEFLALRVENEILRGRLGLEPHANVLPENETENLHVQVVVLRKEISKLRLEVSELKVAEQGLHTETLQATVNELQTAVNELQEDRERQARVQLQRQIMLCMEANILAAMKRSSPTYQGTSLSHMHYSAFHPTPDYDPEINKAQFSKAYCAILVQVFHIKPNKAREFSLELQEFTTSMKNSGNLGPRLIPPVDVQERDFDKYKHEPLPITSPLPWDEFLGALLKLSRDHGKPLIFRVDPPVRRSWGTHSA
jgi:hypothetical protein